MSITIGYTDTQTLAKDWLLSLLLSTYQSALESYDPQNTQHSVFTPYCGDRLLHHHGGGGGVSNNLSPQEILLGFGHPKLHNMVNIVYALLCSDALYPLSCYKQHVYYYPTIDARYAAACNMYSMPPPTFLKCILPSLSLYAANTNKDEDDSFDMQCIVEHLGLSREEVQKTINDQKRYCEDNNEHLLLILDSTKQILCCLYSFDNLAAPPPLPPPKEILNHPILNELLETKMKQYKFPPPIHKMQLSSFSSRDACRLLDAFVEDVGLECGGEEDGQGIESYRHWCGLFADMVHE